MKQMLNLACLALFATMVIAAAKEEWNSAGIAGLGVLLIALALLGVEAREWLVRKQQGERR